MYPKPVWSNVLWTFLGFWMFWSRLLWKMSSFMFCSTILWKISSLLRNISSSLITHIIFAISLLYQQQPNSLLVVHLFHHNIYHIIISDTKLICNLCSLHYLIYLIQNFSIFVMGKDSCIRIRRKMLILLIYKMKRTNLKL